MKLPVLLVLLFFGAANRLMAQLCNGNLSDPIINMTFGNSHEFALEKKATTYELVQGCPNKGQYTISPFIYGCGNNSWFALIGDHTGDYNGNYMLVNAESTAGTIYTDTANNLCGNTTYQFAAWITNVLQSFSCNGNSILSNLTFTVTSLAGASLATYSTGNIPIGGGKNWMHYGLTFVTPADVSSVILSVTATPAFGCGSAFAIDDITLNSCGPLLTVTIDGNPGPAEVCADYTNPFIMTAAYAAGFTDPVFQWQSSLDSGRSFIDIPGETTLTYTVPHRLSGAIVYRIVMAERPNIGSLACRIPSNQIYTEIHPLVAHIPPQNVLGCLDKDLHLPEADLTSLQVLWSGPNAFTSVMPAAVVPHVQYADTGLYLLKETFYFGCVTLDTFYVKIYPSTTITSQPTYPICEGTGEQLVVSATGGGTYSWIPPTGLSDPTIGNPVARPTDSTRYKVIVTNSFGCKDSATLVINVYKLPVVNAGPDKVIISGDTAVLNGFVKGTSTTFSWSPPDFMDNNQLITPTVYPQASMTYTLSAVSNVGCGAVSDNVLVKVYNDIYVPSAFTPNGDGKNDKFQVFPFETYKVVRFLIYNRWGGLIYKAVDNYNGWDGTLKGMPQPAGAYVYYLELQGKLNKTIVKKGTVMLIR